MNNIFTIERRKDFADSFESFFEDLETTVKPSNYKTYEMFSYLDRCIRYWPYRCGATSIEDYLDGIGVDITEPKNDKDLLLTLELIINLLHWAPVQEEMDNTSFTFSLDKSEVRAESKRMLENAEYLLEQCCNMTIREEDAKGFPKYYITRRSAYVDFAVNAVPELSEILLGYLDIRNEDNLKYKKTALTNIYNYMEPHRKNYKSTICSSVSEEFFASMNTFGIRHNTKSQVRIQPKKKKEVCDKLFMMAVYVLQTEEINQYKKELKLLREK